MTIADSPVQSYFKGSFISSWDAETQKIFSGRSSKCIESLVSGEREGRTEKSASMHVPWEDGIQLSLVE